MPDIEAVLAANEKLSQDVLRASADSIDQSRRFPRENLHALGKSGVLGLLIPAEYGEREQGWPKCRASWTCRHKAAHPRPWLRSCISARLP